MLFARTRSSSYADPEGNRLSSYIVSFEFFSLFNMAKIFLLFKETTKDVDKLSASMQIGNNGSRRRSRSQSRATSGSRTDLSTDDEGIPPSPKITLSGRPNSSAENESIKETKSTDSNGPPPTRNNTIKVILIGMFVVVLILLVLNY